eukprot:g8932.t1
MSLHNFFKRKAPSSSGSKSGTSSESASAKGSAKRVKYSRKNALKIISWNANGIFSRFQYDMRDIEAMLVKYDPDVVCIQETKLKAQCSNPKAKRGDHHKRFRSKLSQATKKDVESYHTLQRALATGSLKKYRTFWSLADWKYAGTCCLVKRDIEVQSVKYWLPNSTTKSHNSDGRIIILEFEKYFLMNTYAPNNGKTKESWARRIKWDSDLLDAMKNHFKGDAKPLIWVGDLNVNRRNEDVSDVTFFRDEKCSLYRNAPRPTDPNNLGYPGFTINEMNRFDEIYSSGNFVDTYRKFVPYGSPKIDLSTEFTWRGNRPVHVAYSPFYGKGMRIDYLLVQKPLEENIKSSKILGHGIDRKEFLGSDHCPIELVLDL